MHTEEYKQFIEEFISDETPNLDLSAKQVDKFAKEAKRLEKEPDFTTDDLIEELKAVAPEDINLETEDWKYFFNEVSGLIIDEIEASFDIDDEDVGEYRDDSDE